MPKEQWLGSAILLASVLTTAVNEQRLVRHSSSLEEGRRHVVSLSKPVVVAQNEGQLVHFSGVITTDPSVLAADSTASRVPYVLDPVFGIAARGVRLYRTVEMLQWVETVHTIAGSDPMAGDDDRDGGVDEHREKTYIYDLRWRSERIDSMSFHDIGYQNPPEDAWVFQSKVMDSDAVVVGDFELSRELIDQIERRDPIELDAKAMQTMRIVLNQRIGEDWSKASALKDVSVEDKYFYLLRDGSARPSLGDIRVSFKVTPSYPVTVSGKQKAQQILPYETKAGESILILEDGILTATELYDNKLAIKYQHNRFYRLFTSTLGFLGFLVLYPILAARFGRAFTSVQKHLVCCILGGGTTFSVAGLVWVLHRPLWALMLAAGGLSPTLVLVAFVRSAMQRRSLSEAKNQ